jgi:4-alpha-glucanotransferase
MNRRRAGILLHISSLPGPHGIGDLGPAAYAFVDALERAGQTLWQVLPIGPVGYRGTPYQSPSSFAGNELFISLEELEEIGLLAAGSLAEATVFSTTKVDYDRVASWKRRRLLDAYGRFGALADAATKARFKNFCDAEAAWLDDYAMFTVLKDRHDGAAWTSWEAPFVQRKPAALKEAREKLGEAMEAERFIQFLFAEQWKALKKYANEHGVQIIGDVPIFVAHDSADVWANQELFYLDKAGRPTFVAGVPPDYFSATGQLWGNPLYRWEVMAETGYLWWIERLRQSFHDFDLLRIDHFRGFESYWEVPGHATTAIDGRWTAGPGIALFRAAEKALGPLPLIAEDLGVITPEVEALRKELGAPGMKVLQFAFGTESNAKNYLPHNYERNYVVYTGTHDNDTTVGWFLTEAEPGGLRTQDDLDAERARALAYLGSDGRDIAWDMIRAALASTADTAIVPLQDVLALGNEARMNLPGTAEGNWSWRFAEDQFLPDMERRLRSLTEIYERAPISESPAAPSEQQGHIHDAAS